jgi:hypothetical protein
MYLVVEGTYPLNFLCKAPSVYRIARELWTPMYSLLNQLDFPFAEYKWWLLTFEKPSRNKLKFHRW